MRFLTVGQSNTDWISPLQQNNNIFTSWNFPNFQTFIQDELTMEADCKEQAQTVCTCNSHIKKAFRGRQTLMGRNDRHNLI